MFETKKPHTLPSVNVEAKAVGINCILITIPADNGDLAVDTLKETLKVLNTPTRKITSINCTPTQWGGYYKAWVTFEGDPLVVGNTLTNK